MQTTLIKHPKLRVRKYTGTEGPHHDPYGYEEITIETPDHTITFHEGLGVWVKVDDGMKQNATGDNYDRSRQWADSFILPTIGYSLQQLERMSRKSKQNCPAGGRHETETLGGYPGETFEVCRKCSKHVDYYFNESAII